MKFIAITAIAIIVSTASVVMCYDEKFDKLDIDKIIADDKLFNSYINCYLDKGPCDAELSAELKGRNLLAIAEHLALLPEVLQTACEKCSKLQKENIGKTFKAVIEKQPILAIELQKKYDPDNKLWDNLKKMVID